MKFIKNESGNSIINIAHIRRIYIDTPKFEATKYRVIADMTYGSDILFSDTLELKCRAFMERVLRDINGEE